MKKSLKNKIKKLTNNNSLTLHFKISLVFIIFSIFIIILYSILERQFFEDETERVAMQNAIKKVQERENVVKRLLEKSSMHLNTIHDSNVFQKYLEDISNENGILESLKFVHKMGDQFFQIRFIDQNGMERLKVYRESFGSQVKIASNELLQNKSNRDYFKRSKNEEDIYFSSIDLNREYGQVQLPYTPTLRGIKSVYKDGEFRGIIVINYFMENFLNMLVNAPLYDIVLVNKNGHTLLHHDSEFDWGYYQEPKYEIDLGNSYYKDTYLIKKFDLPIKDGLVMMLKLNEVYLEDLKDQKDKRSYIEFAIIILTSIFVSIVIGKMVEELIFKLEYSQKENKVISRLVKMEIKRSQDKDRMIFEQNKHIAMGQMIENISHQWRQPLAQINSVIYRIDHNLSTGLDKNTLNKDMDEIEGITKYLSQTIDDFRDFMSIKKGKSDFNVRSSIEEILKIVKGTLSSSNIKLINNVNIDIEINGYENQFKQAMLNIINNSRDVLVQRNISRPIIELGIKVKDNKVILTISDNGGGVDKDIKDNIYEPYFTTKYKSQGTGLGLYITKMIINTMDAQIYSKNKIDGLKTYIEFSKGKKTDE